MARSHKKKNANKQADNNQSTIPFLQQDLRQTQNDHDYHPPGQNNKGDYFGDTYSTGVNIYALVDSWRSYRDDATNLQALSGASPALNATANSFVPTASFQQPSGQSSFLPYQPLRISNGVAERTVAQVASRPYSTSFASRYPTRFGVALQDEPLPSIENSDNYVTQPFLDAVKQIQVRYQPSKTKKNKTKATDLKTDERFRARTPAKTASPPPPQTTENYLAEASKLPTRLPEPKKLLVILDLNGTLLLRKKASSMSNPIMRPGVTPLLDYLFNNHAVMVYTSAMPESAARMINFFLHPSQRQQLVAVWARDKLDLTPEQFRNKVQVYKKLEKIWKDVSIQKTAGFGRKWDQSNTVLIDDSKLKALAQPYNLLQIPEYTKEDLPPQGKAQNKQQHADLNKIQIDIMRGVELKLEELRCQDNVSRLIRMWRTGETAIPMVPGEKVVIEDSKADTQSQEPSVEVVNEDDGTEEVYIRTHLPTPQSMGDDEETPERIVPANEDVDNDDGGVATHGLVDRSVSPINESVFKELLEGTGK